MRLFFSVCRVFKFSFDGPQEQTTDTSVEKVLECTQKEMVTVGITFRHRHHIHVTCYLHRTHHFYSKRKTLSTRKSMLACLVYSSFFVSRRKKTERSRDQSTRSPVAQEWVLLVTCKNILLVTKPFIRYRCKKLYICGILLTSIDHRHGRMQ